MDKTTALRLAKEMKIYFEQILREEWEMMILKKLFESPFGKDLVFKGGTALRLAYNSPRFSEDLDFSILKKISDIVFSSEIKKIESQFPQVKITDLKSKYYTYLAEFKIKEDWKETPFRIKVEISKRKTFKKGKGYELLLLTSLVTNVQALGNVATLEQIIKEKYRAARSRGKARDIFDLWFINQKLKRKLDLKGIKVPRKEMKRDLRKYLPENYWSVIEKLG